MLKDLIMAYATAKTPKEKEKAERNCRMVGIDKMTLDILAKEVLKNEGK